MQIYFKQLSICLLLIFLPTQIGLHFWPDWAYVYGLKIDLLSPTLYLTDVLVVAALITHYSDIAKLFSQKFNLNSIKGKTNFKYLLIFLIFIILNIYFSVSRPETIYRWVKIFELVVVSITVFLEKPAQSKLINKILFYGATVASILGILHFTFGSTLGGLFYFFGERTFNISTPGIALVNLSGQEYLRAYSLFSHPNSFAGYLASVLILSFLSGTIKRNILNILCYFLISFGILLTFSAAVHLGIFVAFLFKLIYHQRKIFNIGVKLYFFAVILISLLTPIMALHMNKINIVFGQSIVQRAELSNIAGQVISNNFLSGVGLGNFIKAVPDASTLYSSLWILQPVHNIFLIVLAELSIIGLMAFCYLTYKLIISLVNSNNTNILIVIIFILFTGLLDHYWLTLQQNILLLAVILGLALG